MAGEPIPAQDNGENGLEVLAKIASHAARRVEEAQVPQVVAGEPIPAQDNGENGLEVLAKIEGRFVDHLRVSCSPSASPIVRCGVLVDDHWQRDSAVRPPRLQVRGTQGRVCRRPKSHPSRSTAGKRYQAGPCCT